MKAAAWALLAAAITVTLIQPIAVSGAQTLAQVLTIDGSALTRSGYGDTGSVTAVVTIATTNTTVTINKVAMGTGDVLPTWFRIPTPPFFPAPLGLNGFGTLSFTVNVTKVNELYGESVTNAGFVNVSFTVGGAVGAFCCGQGGPFATYQLIPLVITIISATRVVHPLPTVNPLAPGITYAPGYPICVQGQTFNITIQLRSKPIDPSVTITVSVRAGSPSFYTGTNPYNLSLASVRGATITSSSSLVFDQSNYYRVQRVTFATVPTFESQGTRLMHIRIDSSESTMAATPDFVFVIIDTNTPGWQQTNWNLTAREGVTGYDAAFGVRLTSQPIANVTAVIPLSAVMQMGFTPVLSPVTIPPVPTGSQILTFTPATWNVYQYINVHPSDDRVIEGYLSWNLTFDSALGSSVTSNDLMYLGLKLPNLIVNIWDDDMNYVSISPPAGYRFGGTSVTVAWPEEVTFDGSSVGITGLPFVSCMFGIVDQSAEAVETNSTATVRTPVSVSCASTPCARGLGVAVCQTPIYLYIVINGQWSDGPATFHYVNEHPVISLITPSEADVATATAITLTGQYLVDTNSLTGQQIISCWIDGYLSPTTYFVAAPAGAAATDNAIVCTTPIRTDLAFSTSASQPVPVAVSLNSLISGADLYATNTDGFGYVDLQRARSSNAWTYFVVAATISALTAVVLFGQVHMCPNACACRKPEEEKKEETRGHPIGPGPLIAYLLENVKAEDEEVAAKMNAAALEDAEAQNSAALAAAAAKAAAAGRAKPKAVALVVPVQYEVKVIRRDDESEKVLIVEKEDKRARIKAQAAMGDNRWSAAHLQEADLKRAAKSVVEKEVERQDKIKADKAKAEELKKNGGKPLVTIGETAAGAVVINPDGTTSAVPADGAAGAAGADEKHATTKDKKKKSKKSKKDGAETDRKSKKKDKSAAAVAPTHQTAGSEFKIDVSSPSGAVAPSAAAAAEAGDPTTLPGQVPASPADGNGNVISGTGEKAERARAKSKDGDKKHKSKHKSKHKTGDAAAAAGVELAPITPAAASGADAASPAKASADPAAAAATPSTKPAPIVRKHKKDETPEERAERKARERASGRSRTPKTRTPAGSDAATPAAASAAGAAVVSPPRIRKRDETPEQRAARKERERTEGTDKKKRSSSKPKAAAAATAATTDAAAAAPAPAAMDDPNAAAGAPVEAAAAAPEEHHSEPAQPPAHEEPAAAPAPEPAAEAAPPGDAEAYAAAADLEAAASAASGAEAPVVDAPPEAAAAPATDEAPAPAAE